MFSLAPLQSCFLLLSLSRSAHSEEHELSSFHGSHLKPNGMYDSQGHAKVAFLLRE